MTGRIVVLDPARRLGLDRRDIAGMHQVLAEISDQPVG